MPFKPSAGVFVSGLLLTIFGPIAGLIRTGIASSGQSYYSTGSSVGGGALAFIGFLAGLLGVILIYVGATRIDALPAALGLATPGFNTLPQAPATRRQPDQAQRNYPNTPQPYARPETPQHLIYRSPTPEQQPPPVQ